MDIVNIIISLISGIAGGNLAGAALPEKSLGTIGNSITGLLGGAAGAYIMQALGFLSTVATAIAGQNLTDGNFDLVEFLQVVGGSGAGGAALTAIVGFIKSAIQK